MDEQPDTQILIATRCAMQALGMTCQPQRCSAALGESVRKRRDRKATSRGSYFSRSKSAEVTVIWRQKPVCSRT